MSYELVGILHKKFDTEQKTDTFKAREFVVQTEGEYTQYVKFQCTQDRCSMVDSVNEGDKLKVLFDLRGREWQGKFFTNLNAWKIESMANEQPPVQQQPPMNESNGAMQEMPIDQREDLDDLPF